MSTEMDNNILIKKEKTYVENSSMDESDTDVNDYPSIPVQDALKKIIFFVPEELINRIEFRKLQVEKLSNLYESTRSEEIVDGYSLGPTEMITNKTNRNLPYRRRKTNYQDKSSYAQDDYNYYDLIYSDSNESGKPTSSGWDEKWIKKTNKKFYKNRKRSINGKFNKNFSSSKSNNKGKIRNAPRNGKTFYINYNHKKCYICHSKTHLMRNCPLYINF